MNAAHIDLLVGPAAHTALCDPGFLASWRALFDRCAHATVFQAPAFVRTWYEAYRSAWQPVIVRSESPSGELDGLWLLASDPARRSLVHAGAHQAEYHVWLASPGTDVAFLTAAWSRLERVIPFGRLEFSYLPAATLAAKLRAVPGLGRRLTVRKSLRPLARLEAGDIASSFAKKSNRSRFNRLKKLGRLEFHRVLEPAQLEPVFDDIIAFYDLRQGAVNDVTPFRQDPLKRGFYTRLLAASPDETHVTVSCLDGRAIAAFWGAVSRRTVHLGMLVHSPLLGRHSPGKLHLMQLSRALLAEGRATLDLTPGGDPWKERFANAHDEVAHVTVHRSGLARRRTQAAANLRRSLISGAARIGLDPSNVQRVLEKRQRVRPSALLRRTRRWIATDHEFRVYRGDRNFADNFVTDPRIALNSLADLLLFEPGEAWEERAGFLSTVLARLERGEAVYSVRIGNRLAHYGWLVRNQTESHMSEVQQSLILPAGSVVLYDYHTDPAFRGQGLYRANIGHMLRHAFTDATVHFAYISVLADNLPSRHVIEALGFEYRGSLYRRRRFGSQTLWRDPIFEHRVRVHA